MSKHAFWHVHSHLNGDASQIDRIDHLLVTSLVTWGWIRDNTCTYLPTVHVNLGYISYFIPPSMSTLATLKRQTPSQGANKEVSLTQWLTMKICY